MGEDWAPSRPPITDARVYDYIIVNPPSPSDAKISARAEGWGGAIAHAHSNTWVNTQE